jgi:glycerophosphoryl diester phosphodiesterase
MNLPSSIKNLGRVLRAMHGAGPMTAGAIRRKANMHPDTEITARIRDIRKLGCIVDCYSARQADIVYELERMGVDV